MKKLTAGLVFGLCSTAAVAATPTPEEMWAIIQQQQAEIARLKEQVASADNQIKETGIKVEATANMVEEGLVSGRHSLASSWTERTQIGSYGEMHYNNLTDENYIVGGTALVDSQGVGGFANATPTTYGVELQYRY